MTTVHVVSNITSSLPKRATRTERRKLSLATLARRCEINPSRQPVICQRNGAWIRQSQWRRVSAKCDDVVVFVVLPRGSNGLRLAGMLAILVAAAVLAPALLLSGGIVGVGGIFAAGSTIGTAITAVTTAAIVLGGNYLLNVLVPVKPAGDLGPPDAGSPTYATASSRQNVPRLGAAIPALYGRVRIIPDVCSAAWSEIINRVQILRQVLVLTQGEIEIENIAIGTIPINTFSQVDYEIVTPGNRISIWDSVTSDGYKEVYTSPAVTGLPLLAPNDPDLPTSAPDAIFRGDWDAGTTYAYLDVVSDLLDGNSYVSIQAGNVGNIPSFSLDWWLRFDKYIGTFAGRTSGFSAVPPGQVATLFSLDFTFPAGLFLINSSGDVADTAVTWDIDAQEIDQSGAPVGGWTTISAEFFHSATGSLALSSGYGRNFLGGSFNTQLQKQQPLTFTIRFTMPTAARWQFRCRRTSDNLVQTAPFSQALSWTGLRGFLDHDGRYGECTVMAIQITNQDDINSRLSQEISVIGTRKLPIYDPGSGTWSAPTATRDIAPAIADMLKNQTYGGRRADRDFDVAGLWANQATWTTRGDKFDYYYGQTTQLWSGLGLAARAGRAVPYHQAGIVRFHRDEPQTIPVQMFSRENIIRGSFAMNFITPSPEDESDGLLVKYINQDTWEYASFVIPREGIDVPLNPSTNNFDGVVVTTQVQNEAAYLVAADRYRRVFVSFDTEMEGMIASRGDLIRISHDMPRWGQSTRVFDYNSGSKTLTLWGPLIDIDETATWYAMFRDSRGRPSTETLIASFDEDNLVIVLAEAPVYFDTTPFNMTQNSEAEPLHVVIGKSDSMPMEAIFLGAQPRGDRKVSVTAVLEDARVHVN